MSEKSRISNLPIPTPNKKYYPLMVCLISHISKNGPSTIQNLWNGLKKMGVIHSKRRIKKKIKFYQTKHPQKFPLVNIANLENQENKNEFDSQSFSFSLHHHHYLPLPQQVKPMRP